MTEAQLRESIERWHARIAHERGIVRRHQVIEQRARKMLELRQRELEANNPRIAAVRYALRYVGTVEHPAGSNRGPQVDRWERRIGKWMLGAPWCGAFVIACVELGGGREVDSDGVYVPNIVQHAMARTGGWTGWREATNGVLAGDAVVMSWDGRRTPQHVGIVRRAPKLVGGRILTIEGNTSPGRAGSQSNGGGVFMRERERSVVLGFARWW